MPRNEANIDDLFAVDAELQAKSLEILEDLTQLDPENVAYVGAGAARAAAVATSAAVGLGVVGNTAAAFAAPEVVATQGHDARSHTAPVDQSLEKLLSPKAKDHKPEPQKLTIHDLLDAGIEETAYDGQIHNLVEIADQASAAHHTVGHKREVTHPAKNVARASHEKHGTKLPHSVETIPVETTVWDIAKKLLPVDKHGNEKAIAAKTQELLRFNHLTERQARDLPEGFLLHIPGRIAKHRPGVDVEVRAGETLSGILERNGIKPTPENIRRLHVKHPNLIYPGQHIHIPGYMFAKLHPTHIIRKHPTHHVPVRHLGHHERHYHAKVTKVPHTVVLKALEEMKAQGNNEHANWTNIGKVLEFFIGKGLTPEQSAAIAGNFKTESGVDPSKQQYGGGPGRGLAQWEVGGRWDALVRWAEHHGLDPFALNTQVSYTWHELNTSHTQALHELKKSQTLAQATVAFEKYFEGAGIPHMSVRVQAAVHIYQAVANHVEQIVNNTDTSTSVDSQGGSLGSQEPQTVAPGVSDSADQNTGGGRFQARDVAPAPDQSSGDQGTEHSAPITINSNIEQCPDGATDLGMHDGGIYGEKLALHLCAINGLPSSSEESTPGSQYYIDGAKGNAIVSVEIAAKVVQMVQDAAAAGVHLKAVSSFRTWEHQLSLWSSSDQTGATVGEPGESNHNGAVAIDFDLDGLPISASSYTTVDGNDPSADNPRIAPNSDSWKWLHDNASKYGLQQYFNEPWHFSVDGH